DGAAFEWGLADDSLGPVQAEGGQVYSQSVDLAGERPPATSEVPGDRAIAAEAPPTPPPSATRTPTGSATSATPPAASRPAPRPAPPPAHPRAPPPAARSPTEPPPRELPAVQTPAPSQPQTPATDPALAAYPDQ